MKFLRAMIIEFYRYNIESDDYSKLEKEKNVHILTGIIKLFFR